MYLPRLFAALALCTSAFAQQNPVALTSADYARAEAELDTSGEAVEQSFAKLLRIVTQLIGPQTQVQP